MSSPQALIELKHVALHYRLKRKLRGSTRHQVLRDINLTLYSGETVGVVGRNGAGKSTLLKLIANIISPDSGEVIRRTDKISLLAYQLGLSPNLSGRDNAVQMAMLQGMPRREVLRRMDEVIEFSGLGVMIDEPASTYSAGMRARLGFSVSLLLEPDLMLIDEALGVGDAEFKQRSTAAMKERIQSEKTVVLVSHSLETLEELCDRAIWIENGEVVDTGSPDTVLRDYGEFDKIIRRRSREYGQSPLDVREQLKQLDPMQVLSVYAERDANELRLAREQKTTVHQVRFQLKDDDPLAPLLKTTETLDA